MNKLPLLILSFSAYLAGQQSFAEQELELEEEKYQENLLEEVWVYAQKRNENLFDVPIAIQVLDSEYIKNSGATGISELDAAMPSVNFGRSSRKIRGEVTIRGVGDYSRNIGTNARVAVYVDEVPLGRSSAFDATLMDVQQVEVLKGPQGTLYGANSISGAINILSKDPEDETKNEINVSGGQRGYGFYSLNSNVAFNNYLKLRVNLAHKESDGHIKNIYSGDTLQGSDLNSARITLLYSPSNSFKVRFSADWLEDEALATNAEAINDQFAPEIFEVAHDTKEYEERNIWGSALKISSQISDNTELVSVSGYRSSAFEALSEEDYSPALLQTTTSPPTPRADSFFDEEYEQITQEFRLDKKLNKQFNLLGGIFAQHSETSTKRSARILNVFGPQPPLYLTARTPGSLKSENYALFGSLDWNLSEKLALNLGARWKTETKRLDYAIDDESPLFITGTTKEKETYTDFLPRFSVQLKDTLGELLYFTVSKGEKSGGWNADFVTDFDEIAFDSEYSTNYEIGTKSRFANNRSQIQISLFRTEFKDFQVIQFEESQPNIRNAAEATTQGLEFESKTLLNEYLDISFAVTFTDAEYNAFTNANEAGDDFTGNKLQFAPEVAAYLAIDLRLPGGLSDSSEHRLHLSSGYSDSYFSGPENNKETELIESFYIVNGHYKFVINEDIEFTLWGKNLTDEEVLRYRGESFLGVQRGYYEPPRTVGFSFTSRF